MLRCLKCPKYIPNLATSFLATLKRPCFDDYARNILHYISLLMMRMSKKFNTTTKLWEAMKIIS